MKPTVVSGVCGGRLNRSVHHLGMGVEEFAGTLATRIVQLKPRDPESKGIVERRNGYFETSFMPGRSFTSPADFNAQFADWLAIAVRANHRRRGRLPLVRAGRRQPVLPARFVS